MISSRGKFNEIMQSKLERLITGDDKNGIQGTFKDDIEKLKEDIQNSKIGKQSVYEKYRGLKQQIKQFQNKEANVDDNTDGNGLTSYGQWHEDCENARLEQENPLFSGQDVNNEKNEAAWEAGAAENDGYLNNDAKLGTLDTKNRDISEGSDNLGGEVEDYDESSAWDDVIDDENIVRKPANGDNKVADDNSVENKGKKEDLDEDFQFIGEGKNEEDAVVSNLMNGETVTTDEIKNGEISDETQTYNLRKEDSSGIDDAKSVEKQKGQRQEEFIAKTLKEFEGQPELQEALKDKLDKLKDKYHGLAFNARVKRVIIRAKKLQTKFNELDGLKDAGKISDTECNDYKRDLTKFFQDTKSGLTHSAKFNARMNEILVRAQREKEIAEEVTSADDFNNQRDDPIWASDVNDNDNPLFNGTEEEVDGVGMIYPDFEEGWGSSVI